MNQDPSVFAPQILGVTHKFRQQPGNKNTFYLILDWSVSSTGAEVEGTIVGSL